MKGFIRWVKYWFGPLPKKEPQPFTLIFRTHTSVESVIDSIKAQTPAPKKIKP